MKNSDNLQNESTELSGFSGYAFYGVMRFSGLFFAHNNGAPFWGERERFYRTLPHYEKLNGCRAVVYEDIRLSVADFSSSSGFFSLNLPDHSLQVVTVVFPERLPHPRDVAFFCVLLH